MARVDDRDAYVLIIEDSPTQSTQLFFDVESGLLVRKVFVINTMLGPLNVQWDFSDYRDIGGIKLPFIIRTSDVAAFDTVVRKFSEIKIDLHLMTVSLTRLGSFIPKSNEGINLRRASRGKVAGE